MATGDIPSSLSRRHPVAGSSGRSKTQRTQAGPRNNCFKGSTIVIAKRDRDPTAEIFVSGAGVLGAIDCETPFTVNKSGEPVAEAISFQVLYQGIAHRPL